MQIKQIAVAATAGVLMTGLAACGGSGSSGGSDSGSSSGGNSGKSTSQSSSKNMASKAQFGPGCKAVPKSGKGSFKGMAKDPVATAASNNKALSTLVSAVKKAGLTDTLNNAKHITVFAPTNDAFDKVPKKQLNSLLSDKNKLAKVLQYHVIGKQVTPKQMRSGDFKSLAGPKVKTSGMDKKFKVNGKSNVVCGNVQTANATVYLVDGVLMPPM